MTKTPISQMNSTSQPVTAATAPTPTATVSTPTGPPQPTPRPTTTAPAAEPHVEEAVRPPPARPGAVPSLPAETGVPYQPSFRASEYRQNPNAMESPRQWQRQQQEEEEEEASETLLGRLGKWVESVNSKIAQSRIAGDGNGKGNE